MGSEAPGCGPDTNSSQRDAGGFPLPAPARRGPADALGEDPSACSGDPGPPAQLPFFLWIFQETDFGWDEGRVSQKLRASLEALGVRCSQPLYGGQERGRPCLGLHSKLVVGQGHRGSPPTPGQGSSQSPTKLSLQPRYTPGQESLSRLTGALSDI